INETTRCFGAAPVSIIVRRPQQEANMADYDNTNRGALFRNDDKDPNNDKERDYSGSLDVEGAGYWISGWGRTSKAGKKYLSLSVKPKQAKPTASDPTASNKPRTEAGSSTPAFDDAIPF